jgi:hypothetical protein
MRFNFFSPFPPGIKGKEMQGFLKNGIPFFKNSPKQWTKNKLGNYVTSDFTKKIGAGPDLGFYPLLGTALQLEEGL